MDNLKLTLDPGYGWGYPEHFLPQEERMRRWISELERQISRKIDAALAPRGVALLKMRLARICRALQLDGKLRAVYSWHDFRHAFAQATVGRGMQRLKAALGHSSISVTERYLKNSLALDTGKM
jgi:site-specific recombinase XerD